MGSRAGGGRVANLPAGGRAGSGAARSGVGNRAGNIGGANVGSLPNRGARPSTRDVQNFLGIPGSGMAGGARPSTLPSNGGRNFAAGAAGALAGGAAAEFLSNRPSTGLPDGGARPGAGNVASQLPAGPGRGGGDLGRPGQPDIGRGEIGRGEIGRGDVGRRGGIGEGRGDIGRPGRPGENLAGGQFRDRVQNLPSRIGDREGWQNWRNEHRGDIGDFWQNHAGDFGDWYGDSWWDHNHINYPYYPGFGIWGWAAWSGLSGWVDYGWSDPVYYNYGDNVYYDDGSVYYGDQAVCTTDEYVQQAEAIATSVPEAQPAATDWMPLGVFAMTTDGEPTGADPTMFLQLAVSKQGIINGTFQDTASGKVQAVEGMVDKQTQRAAWTAVGKSRPLMETGIANLTQDMTGTLVHFPDGTTQQWLLVRLDKPGAAQTGPPQTK